MWEEYRASSEVLPTVQINTMYKPKWKKVNPVDDVPPDGSVPPGNPGWKEIELERVKEDLARKGCQSDVPGSPQAALFPRFADMPKGTRLTDQRLEEVMKQIGDRFTPLEKALFREILYRREAALGWDWLDTGKIKSVVAPDYEIRTVPHSAWQAKSIPVPLGMMDKFLKVLRIRIEKGILEESHAAYRNAWFIVKKKDGGLRLINSATKLNAVTIRDAWMPENCDEFSADFAMCSLVTLVDLFSGYDQTALAVASRDFTTFATPLGLLRMTTLPMGATNSVAHFCRVVGRILYDLMPDVARPFVDDIGIKAPKTKYNGEESFPGIRRYVYEHLVNVDKTLLNFELAGATISMAKSHWCQEATVIVGFLCGTNGRRPDEAKVVKILEIKRCNNVSEIRAFLGITVFYRIFVIYYAMKAEPLTRLLRKGAQFEWADEQQQALQTLQAAITSAPTLITLDYKVGAGLIVVRVDASGEGWGATIGQVINGVEHPARYESGTWKGAECNYDATKKECRAVLKALRRFRNYVYGIRFTLETDAKVLVSQINDSMDSLPGALLTRWIAWIKLFDFEIKHIPGKKNTAADGLSRKPAGPSDELDDQWEGEVDDFIDVQLDVINISMNLILTGSTSIPAKDESTPTPLEGNWTKESQDYARFLTTLELPDDLLGEPNAELDRKRASFKSRAMGYFVQDGILWKRASKQYGPRRVVDDPRERLMVRSQCHEESGHKGRDATYKRIAASYYWKGMYSEVREAVAVCVPCQKAADRRMEEAHGFTQPIDVAAVWVLDVQFMPNDYGFKAIVEARCDVSGYPEARPLRVVTSKVIRLFLEECIFYRHGIPVKLKVDGGSENKGEVIEACDELAVTRVVGPAYNPRSQGLIEKGHVPITKALMKETNGTGKGWVKRLIRVLFADRTTVKSHGFTSHELVYGAKALLPIETALPTWRIMNWSPNTPREDLISQRVRLMERRSEDIEKAMRMLTMQRKKAAELADHKARHKMRKVPLAVDSLVLLYDEPRHIDMSRSVKLKYRWLGPYLVSKLVGASTYRLKEIDGTELQGIFNARRLKQFLQDTKGFWEPIDLQEDDWTKPSDDQEKDTVPDQQSKTVEPAEDWQPKASEQVETNIEVQIPVGAMEGYDIIDDE